MHLFQRRLPPLDEDDDIRPACIHCILLWLRAALIHIYFEALACQKHGSSGACRPSAHHYCPLARVQLAGGGGGGGARGSLCDRLQPVRVVLGGRGAWM